MSRSGYTDDGEGWQLGQWRGRVTSAMRGHRGQALLRDMKMALESMPENERRLIPNELECTDGVCALGAVGRARGVDMSEMDTYDLESLAGAFNVAEALVAEVMDFNDDVCYHCTPEERWHEVHNWALTNLREPLPQIGLHEG